MTLEAVDKCFPFDFQFCDRRKSGGATDLDTVP